MPLTPQSQKVIRDRIASGLPEVWEAPVAVIRANNHAGVAATGEPENIFSIEHQFIPGPTSDLPIRIYRPSDKRNLPAMVFFHGGGWVMGTMDGSEQAVRSIANKGQFIVVAVGYQKAPEHPFPTPFDDCYATTQWVYENATSLGIDPNKIGVAGASAGANLAAAVALKARDTQAIPLAFQALVVPCVDNEMKYPSATENASGYLLSTQGMKWFWSQYLKFARDEKNPYAVPAIAGNFSGLAPAIITTCEFDPLRDDGFNYAQLLTTAGVRTIYREFKGLLHNVIYSARDIPEALELQRFIADSINELLDRKI